MTAWGAWETASLSIGMLATVAVASLLGWFIYRGSHGYDCRYEKVAGETFKENARLHAELLAARDELRKFKEAR